MQPGFTLKTFIYLLTASLFFTTLAQNTKIEPVELNRYKEEYSTVHIEPANMNNAPGIAVVFEGTQDLHYYARAETATAPGYELKITAKSDKFTFDKPVFPNWDIIKDPLGKDVEVYAGNFEVFVPFNTEKSTRTEAEVDVIISSQACTSEICLLPTEKTIRTTVDFSKSDTWPAISFEKKRTEAKEVKPELSYSIWYAIVLAFVAGLSLNIMPCVWPILPLVVLRIVEQAKNNKGKKITMGISFCFGILLFFACLAIANIVLHLTVGTALQWGDQFRNPVFVTVMALVLVVLALFMFDVFTFVVPASVSGKGSSGSGFLGTIGMGFLAAILSTPCSFGILAAVIAWAQCQPLIPATIAILVIGLGMGTPYVILTAIPGLIEKLPKPGTWMEIFKKFVGFILLAVAVWLITVLPAAKRAGILYYAVVLAFCVWMAGGWVNFSSKLKNKIVVRALAVALAVAAGFYLLKPHAELIDWQGYDTQKIENAIEQGQTVLIKFTADWCLSCQWIEKTVYTRKDIAELIEEKNVLVVKADTTLKDTPATKALQNIYNEAVPYSVLHLPDGRKEGWVGKGFGDELMQALEGIE
ncbi:MAG: thioredoxin family protein [Sedimentisphaerales bacterium]|nr:thioredoxin family protein [Sedimentisphaerales bacterium]